MIKAIHKTEASANIGMLIQINRLYPKLDKLITKNDIQWVGDLEVSLDRVRGFTSILEIKNPITIVVQI
jgi:hypothetical protein